MAYIGTRPTVGNFVKLDTITTSATTTFNLLNGGVAYYPQSANHCLVSLNGILQAPTDSFTISGSTIIFSSALTTSDVIDFIIVLGDVLNIGTPSDNTVSLAKLTATGTKDATTFLRGDNTFATVSQKVLQITNNSDATLYALSIPDASTDVAGSIAYSITPTSASSKIIINFTIPQLVHTLGGGVRIRLYRQIAGGGYSHVTALSGTPAGSRFGSLFGNYSSTTDAGMDSNRSRAFAGTIVDSPATTSAVDYKFYVGAGDGASSVYINRTSGDADATYTSRTRTHVTLMEVSI